MINYLSKTVSPFEYLHPLGGKIIANMVAEKADKIEFHQSVELDANWVIIPEDRK